MNTIIQGDHAMNETDYRLRVLELLEDPRGWARLTFAAIMGVWIAHACDARADTLRAWTPDPTVTQVTFEVEGLSALSTAVGEVMPDGSRVFVATFTGMPYPYSVVARSCRGAVCSAPSAPLTVAAPPPPTSLPTPLVKGVIGSQGTLTAQLKDYGGYQITGQRAAWEVAPEGLGWWAEVPGGPLVATPGLPANERHVTLPDLWPGCARLRARLEAPDGRRSPWSAPIAVAPLHWAAGSCGRRSRAIPRARARGPGARGPGRVGLILRPISIRAASAFVALHHRHHKPPRGALFALSALADDEIVGVVIVGRPVARMLADGFTAEVTRLATTGHRNACSFLYARAWHAAQTLGYRRLVTYTLPEEGGASLHASGWVLMGEAGGGSWSRPSRARLDDHPTSVKLRWEKRLSPPKSRR